MDFQRKMTVLGQSLFILVPFNESQWAARFPTVPFTPATNSEERTGAAHFRGVYDSGDCICGYCRIPTPPWSVLQSQYAKVRRTRPAGSDLHAAFDVFRGFFA